MTREEAIERLKTDIYKYADFTENPNENEFWMAFDLAIKALEQEPILDKIYADIQRLRGCSCSCSDGIIDDVEDILDKYKADRSEKETETWNGIHAQITVPKGTFDKIFNDTEEDIDDI